jgi:hypothetical protein
MKDLKDFEQKFIDKYAEEDDDDSDSKKKTSLASKNEQISEQTEDESAMTQEK